MKPAIVVVAYNRPKQLARLLESLSRAVYYHDDISLIISIDGCGPEEVVTVAKSFIWGHGDKNILHRPTRLGLRSHILSCGDLTEYYGSIILLEDDLIVSRYFYGYAVSALKAYEFEKRVAGISLYSFRNNEYAECAPFWPLDNGFDAYFMQVPSSRGVCWTKEQWAGFSFFIKENKRISEIDALPDDVKSWKDTSWKKDFCKYLADNDLFFSVPYLSHSTNFGDAGTNVKNVTHVYQTPLVHSAKEYRFPHFDGTNVAYDSYMELLPSCFPEWFTTKYQDIVIDTYGTKQHAIFGQGLWLTSRPCNGAETSFGVCLIPVENNIFFNIAGDFLKICSAKQIMFERPNNYYAELAKVDSQFAVYEGERRVRLSKSYRIGRFLLAPFMFMKKS